MRFFSCMFLCVSGLLASSAWAEQRALGDMGAHELKEEIMLLRAQMREMQKIQNQIISSHNAVVTQSNNEKNVNADFRREQKDTLASLGDVVGIAPAYSDTMLNWQSDVTGKPRKLLEARQDGTLGNKKAYLSGAFKASGMAETSNTDGKFAILSRFPNQHGSGKFGSRFLVNNAALGVTGTVNDWVSSYAQIEYSEIEYPGQEEIQFRKAYLLLGNLEESPWYAYLGRNTIDFGDQDSYNPFTHTTVNHYFNAVSDDPVLAVGYYGGGWDVVATAINGGRQLRVADIYQTDNVRNFAFNANKTFDLGGGSAFRLGASYLHGTIYNSAVPHHLITTDTPRDRVAAAGAVMEYTSPSWDFMVEFIATLDEWEATDEPVWAGVVQGAYKFPSWGRPSELSLVYNRGEQGRSGTEFEFMEAAILGYELELFPHFYLGGEYVFNHGFAPLINVTTSSDAGVVNHSLILGGRYVF